MNRVNEFLLAPYECTYSLSTSLDIAGVRHILSVQAVASSLSDPGTSGQEAVEDAVFDLYKQARALLAGAGG